MSTLPRTTRRCGARGFTLAELAVTLGVSALAVTALMGVFLSQQRSMQGQENGRKLQESVRAATLVVERSLRRAGWGIDPPQAFDFGVYPALPCSVAPCARDRNDGPDRVVFYARNPQYQINNGALSGKVWLLKGTTGGLQLAATSASDKWVQGQLLLAMCAGGADAAFVEVATTTQASAQGVSLTVPLRTGLTDVLHQLGKITTAGSCFLNGLGVDTLVFQVDRYHFLVNNYTDQNGTTTPWLVLDRGLDENGDNAVDTKDFLPVAEGVEDLQVTYVMNSSSTLTAPDTNAPVNWAFGDASAGTVETPNVNAVAPLFTDAQAAASRFTGHPANIRAVRLDLTVRAPLAGKGAGSPEAPQALQNRTASSLPATGNYRRQTVTVSVATPNLASRSRFRF